jgi:uncharacterized protein with GYD domain
VPFVLANRQRRSQKEDSRSQTAFVGVKFSVQEIAMPSYIALLNWTHQGLQNIKQSPSRLDAARKGFEAAGVKMKDFYMVTGHYDMVAVVDAPDDLALAKAVLTLSSQGSVRTETCRAFSESEYRQIVTGLA